MKVFLSSLIGGFEELRDAAAAGIETLGHVVVRAEDFSASHDSPQSACLAGVRDSDLVVLVLGDRYGYVQASGLSATHEEYLEARPNRPVLVFLLGDRNPEARQIDFINDVQGWEQGHFTADFVDADDLKAKIILALHNQAMAYASAPLDADALVERALQLAAPSGRRSDAELVVAVAAGPAQPVLRPAELETDALSQFLHQATLMGAHALFDTRHGTHVELRGDSIHLEQSDVARSVTLNETGDMVLRQPAVERAARSVTMIEGIVTEVLIDKISLSLRLAGEILNHVDPVKRVTHVGVAVSLQGVGYLSWRSAQQQQRSPLTVTIGLGSKASEAVVMLSPPVHRREALGHNPHDLAEDFVVRLRREIQR